MYCIMCEGLSLTHICNNCQKTFLTPSLYKRKIANGIEVLSFYKYEDIQKLLHTKHTDIGYYIFNILAQNSFQKFAQNFKFIEKVAAIAIDDNPKGSYSHTAILNKHLTSTTITPRYNRLRATNNISYSGKDKAFRLSHPRDFRLKNIKEQYIILTDDIITTGSTLTEALQLFQKVDKEVLFCITLTDVNNK